MIHWTSPFILPSTLREMLEGLVSHGALPFSSSPPAAEGRLLVFYSSPVTLLTTGVRSPTPGCQPTSPEQILKGYRAISALRQESLKCSSEVVLLAADRIEPAHLRTWLVEGTLPDTSNDLPSPSPLEVLITLWTIEQMPELLDAYLDLELQVELIGREPDLQCRQHWQQLLGVEAMFQDCHHTASTWLQMDRTIDQLKQARDDLDRQRFALQTALEQEAASKNQLEQQIFSIKAELGSANEKNELILQQLQTVQDDLEQYVLLSERQKEELQRLSASYEQLMTQHNQLEVQRDQYKTERDQAFSESESLKSQHSQLLANHDILQKALEDEVAARNHLEQQTASINGDLATAREKAGLTLHQLHQVQEELERYFLENQRYQAISEDLQQQMARAERLLLHQARPAF